MIDILIQIYIIRNVPSHDKGRLRKIYSGRKNILQMVSQNLNNHLIKVITKGDRFIVSNVIGIFNL